MFQNNASNFIVYPSNLYKKDIWGFFFVVYTGTTAFL